MTTRTTRRAIESDDELLRFEEDTAEFSVEFDDARIADRDEDSRESSLPSPMAADYEQRLLAAQEQLQMLRQQQETIERQKRELEDLNEKQRTFVSGRTDLSNRLSRSIAMLEREAKDSRKRIEVFDSTRESLEQHYESINALKPEHWDRAELRNELTRSLTLIEDVAEDFDKQMSKVQALRQAPGTEPARAAANRAAGAAGASRLAPAFPAGFKEWFLSGLAFTLPLMILGTLALLLAGLLFQ